MKPATLTTLVVLVVFLVLGPALILWTAGYRWNPRTARLEATGIILVDTVPTGAAIAIGEERREEITPTRITGLLPREYAVTISKPGYRPWRQVVAIAGGKTSFLDHVRLFPDARPSSVLDLPAERLSLSADRSRLAVAAKAEDFTEVWSVPVAGGSPTLLARLASSTVRSLAWAPNGSGLLVVEEAADGVRASVLAPNRRTPVKIPDEALSDIGWSEDDPGKLVAVGAAAPSRAPGVWLVSAGSGEAALLWRPNSTSSPETSTKAGGATTLALPLLRGGALTLLERRATTTAVLSLAPGPGKTPTELLVLPGGPYRFLTAPSPFLALAYPAREQVTVVDAASRRVLATLPADDAAWPSTGGEALAWDAFELRLIAGEGAPTTLARFAEGIRAAGWLAEGTHALLLTPTALRAVERDAIAGSRVVTELAAFADASRLVVADDAAFVAGTVDGKQGVWRVGLK